MATAAEQKTSQAIQLQPGQTVQVHQKIKEGNKERIQIFEGLIVDIRGRSGVNHTFVVRKVVDGIGVEKIFAVQSPFIDKIVILKQARVRRANIGYMRSRTGKAARMKNEEKIDVVLDRKLKTETSDDVAAPDTQEAEKADAPAEEAKASEVKDTSKDEAQKESEKASADEPAKDVKAESESNEASESPASEEKKEKEESQEADQSVDNSAQAEESKESEEKKD